MTSKICMRCIADARINHYEALHVQWQDEDREEFEHRFGASLWSHLPDRLPQMISVLEFALERERRIIGATGELIEMPGLSWKGDPICSAHLIQARRLELEPQTVRMGHWRP